VFYGLHLISDGGYHRWLCFLYPIKSGLAGSPTMKCSAKINQSGRTLKGALKFSRKGLPS
jgi:hypothetical protein